VRPEVWSCFASWVGDYCVKGQNFYKGNYAAGEFFWGFPLIKPQAKKLYDKMFAVLGGGGNFFPGTSWEWGGGGRE